MQAFEELNPDLSYFEVLRRELEDQHSDYIRKVIAIFEKQYLEGTDKEKAALKEKYVSEGIQHHQAMWDALRERYTEKTKVIG